ncbi:hypothetical protein JNUCC0626_13240 [Lentzea sp. JNUCC 0626]|uniref:hypothetical protein n=1 Tax=Lentzea sp. JNUCC 0626 TaxID=3367513 RepID=UPI003748A8A4
MRTIGRRISIIACTTALASLAALPALAAAPPVPAIPALGAVATLKLTAPGVEIRIGAKTEKVDLSGDIVVRVVAGETDPLKAVRLRVLDLNLAGKLPKGDVSIRPDTYDAAAAGELRLNTAVPPTLTHTLSLSLRVTVNQPDVSPEPLVLSTKDAAKLVGTLKKFPPTGETHQLQNPVDLVNTAKPNATAAVIAKFALMVG